MTKPSNKYRSRSQEEETRARGRATRETQVKARQVRITQTQIKQAQITQAGITQTTTVPRGKDRSTITQTGVGIVGTTTTIGRAQAGQGELG